MDSSEWIRIKRGKMLSTDGRVTQPNTTGDVLMERNYVNGPILFNGKTVSNCCTEVPVPPVPPSIGTITFTFNITKSASIARNVSNYILFNAGDLGVGTVDFGNGTVLSTADIVVGTQYPVGSTAILRASKSTNVRIQGTMTTVVLDKGNTNLLRLELVGDDTVRKLTQIVGLSNCTSLQNLVINYSLLTVLDITAVAPTLTQLGCDDNTGLTAIIGIGACKVLAILSCGNCSLTSLDITNSGDTLTLLDCRGNTGLDAITGIGACKVLAILSCSGCSLTSLDITNSGDTLTELDCAGNTGLAAIIGIGACKVLAS